jgi:hypothetical protein
MYGDDPVKLFLDVGAHDGGSLNAVRDPKYGFDRIYCFEPASSCWTALEAVSDDRGVLCRFGLWNRTCDPFARPSRARAQGAALHRRAHELLHER